MKGEDDPSMHDRFVPVSNAEARRLEHLINQIENEMKYLRDHLIENHHEMNAHLTNDLGVLIGLHYKAHSKQQYPSVRKEVRNG